MANVNIGSDFDDYLVQEGLLEETTIVAVKRYIAYQIAEQMKQEKMTKTSMAKRMSTSRSSLDRLLDPENASVTLKTLQSAVSTLGGRLKIAIEFENRLV